MGAADPIADDPSPPAPTQAKVVDFRCEQCGAPVIARPGADALECEHCGHSQQIARKEGRIVEYDFKAALAEAPRGAAADLATGAHEVECKGCGARTVTADQSGTCPFCGSPLIPDLKAGDKLMLPESLLPHKISREQAKTEFKRWLRSRWFAPSDLVKRAKTTGLDGVMLPHWTYDSNTSTSYTGLRGDHYYETETYTDSDGKTQSRTVQKTRWTPASGTVYVSFDDVLVCASKSLPANLVRELEPWDLESLQPFDPAYLAGYVTERYQIDLAAGFDLAADRMRPRIRRACESDIGGDVQQVLSMDVTHRDVTFKHLLLPLWISSFRYRERVFRVMVNARTGEVQGERPWSVIKILLFVLFLLSLVIGGVVLWQRSRAPHDEDRYQEPHPNQLPEIQDPIAGLDGITAAAQQRRPGAALTGITLIELDADGTARGAAYVRYRAAGGAGCGTSAVVGGGTMLAWTDDTVGCDAPALLPPTCSLAELIARLPAEAADEASMRVSYQAPRGSRPPEVPAEAPAGTAPPIAAPIAGEWHVGDLVIADDCHPRPAPPAPPPPPTPPPPTGKPVKAVHAPGKPAKPPRRPHPRVRGP